MIASGLISILFKVTPVGPMLFGEEGIMPGWTEYIVLVAITSIIWLAVTFMTQPESDEILTRYAEEN